MIYTNIQKNISTSPRKLRLVADMIRKMTPDQAIITLQFTPRSGSEALAKAIKTTIANAGSISNLSFKSIEINEGLKMRRYRVGTAGRGRGRPYKRRSSHIKIVLTDEIEEKPIVEAQKTRKQQSAKRKEGVTNGPEN